MAVRSKKTVGRKTTPAGSAAPRPQVPASPTPAGKILTVDIGNTNITMGVFQGSNLLGSTRAMTLRRTVDEADAMISSLLAQKGFSLRGIAGVAVASVVPEATSNIHGALKRYRLPVLDLNDPRVRGQVPVDYHPPFSVGADRIANAAAAHELVRSRKSKIIVDFGTATTFDCVLADGTYLGGAIHPGVEISAESLFKKTAQLPQIDFSSSAKAVGKDTAGSIRAGLYFGIIGAVREIVQRIEKEIGSSVRIGTGGLAPLVCPAVGGFHSIDMDLTLKGIKILFDKFQARQVA